jgi:hypothetical protein
VFAVSTDDLRGADYAVEQFEATYPILYSSDDISVPFSYGVFNLHGDGLASGAIFIYDTSRALVWKTVGERYSDTVPSAVLIEALEEINARVDRSDASATDHG